MPLPDPIAHFATGLKLWARHGIPPGSFLRAALQNDLSGAYATGDELSIEHLPALMTYIRSEMPAGCWGSRELFRDWAAMGGLEGIK